MKKIILMALLLLVGCNNALLPECRENSTIEPIAVNNELFYCYNGKLVSNDAYLEIINAYQGGYIQSHSDIFSIITECERTAQVVAGNQTLNVVAIECPLIAQCLRR